MKMSSLSIFCMIPLNVYAKTEYALEIAGDLTGAEMMILTLFHGSKKAMWKYANWCLDILQFQHAVLGMMLDANIIHTIALL